MHRPFTAPMSAKPSSRWANTKEDDALEAKLKKEKEEKKRRKAEKAQKLKEEQAAREAASRREADDDDQQQDLEHRPAKRRRLSPEREASTNDGPAKLLRFGGGTWGRSRSVEEYDKLNDIEEGTYGWVARATQRATGKVVALKRLKLEPGDRNGLPVTGLREIQILRECRHRNIVAMEEVVVGEQTTKPDKYVLPHLSTVML